MATNPPRHRSKVALLGLLLALLTSACSSQPATTANLETAQPSETVASKQTSYVIDDDFYAEPIPGEPSPFCAPFLRLNRLGETIPSTAVDAEETVVAMLEETDAVIAVAPADLQPGAVETQKYLELVAESAGAQNWDLAWFDAVDREGFEASGIDLELMLQFFEAGEDRCLLDKFPELD